MRLLGTLVASSLLTLAACAVGSSNESGATADTSELSAEDFDTAASKLGTLPYLPWHFTTDGCYARALYYSMVLAEAGIPTKHVYVDAKPGTQPLFGIWGWHVAPIATKNGQNELFVFDPALFPDRVITVREWIAKQGYTNPASTDYPYTSIAAGTSYAQSAGDTPLPSVVEPSAALYGEPTFAAMPKFDVGSINAACDVMHSYIEYEPGTNATQKLEKHQGLSDATTRLVRSLQGRNKINGTEAQIAQSCTVPAQLDLTTCQADDANVKPSRAACCVASKHWCWSNKGNGGAGDCMAEGTVEDGSVCTQNQWKVAQSEQP